MTDNKAEFLNLFNVAKPIMGMIHLKGNTDKEIFETAMNEIKTMIEGNVDAVIIENYFGSTKNVEEVLKYINTMDTNIIYGINILEDDKKAFELADKYNASFIQIDSVAGHKEIKEDIKFGDFINSMRMETNAHVLGGVRFKYQPYLSGRTLEEDLEIGMNRCDGIVVTGKGTGSAADINKIQKFRTIIGSQFPLIIGSGLTDQNIDTQLKIADGAIVGSYFKDNYKDSGNICLSHIKQLMEGVQKLRESENENKIGL